jgi:hypothetical protein
MLTVFVYGQVTANGRGIDGALVSTEQGISVSTFSGGYFLMCHPPGTFDMAAYKTGYKPSRRNDVALPEGGFVETNFQLQQ